ncbi:hypothetical protein FGIG_06315 [Fasciola gigantica]|uniref:Uncharacterized protein n=1 Tax=Fasciola gigantica TaxID=46835 RepID=A0A504YU66_FASGI|nr:hypothetical protein FGIG_06315 [Fasciola gigantica]
MNGFALVKMILAGSLLMLLCATVIAIPNPTGYETELDYYPELAYEPIVYDNRGHLPQFGKQLPRAAFVKRGQFLRLG